MSCLFLLSACVVWFIVCLTLLFLTLVFSKVEVEYGIPQGLCNIITGAVGGLLILVLMVYYILAFKYK